MTNTQHFSEYFTTAHMQVDDALKNNQQHAPTKSFPNNLIAHFIKSLMMSKQPNLNTQVQQLLLRDPIKILDK